MIEIHMQDYVHHSMAASFR